MSITTLYEHDDTLIKKWGPVLEGIEDDYTKRVTAQLLENQAAFIIHEKLNEDISPATTTTGRLGTFQKFAFPLVRRVYPELIANKIVGVQPMQGPVSQIFYLGADRARNTTIQTIYSKFNLTYRNMAASSIGSTNFNANYDGSKSETRMAGTFNATNTTSGLDGDWAASGFDTSNVLSAIAGYPDSTVGGKIASWPTTSSILGISLSGGERLTGTGIPEMTFHIEQQAVVARTRKMRALWTIEASQDLKAYHNLDLERELTDLLSKELELEIDRELLEDLRMIAYGFVGTDFNGSMLGGYDPAALKMGNANNFGGTGGTGASFPAGTQQYGDSFIPAAFTYDFAGTNAASVATEFGNDSSGSNIFVIDFGQETLSFSPRHIGDVYANLLAIINLASQDIYRTTWRGPGTWMVTSPLIASLIESSAKLHGGIDPGDKPTNIGSNSIEYKGKVLNKYDLYIDPMWPQDEILMGYKGANAMDAGYVYCPYIPLQQLPTITDPESFQPRKGILTRYGKAMISPSSRYYRVIRIIGPTSNFLFTPFARNTSINTVGSLDY